MQNPQNYLLRKIALPSVIVALMAGAAGATPVTFTTYSTGSFPIDPQTLTFDANAWADDATIVSTGGTGTPAASPASGADGDLSTATNLNDSFVELFFTDNVLINGPGADLVIFQNTNNNVIQLGGDAAFSTVSIGIGSTRFIFDTDPGNTSGITIGVREFDLSDLGFADGAEVTDGLFLRRASIFSTVWDVAALNSRDAVITDPGAVPLPAAAWLLLAGVGGLSLLRRRPTA